MRSLNLATPLQLFTEHDRAQILDHLLRLSVTDRYLRFCSPLSDDAIRAYVNRLDLTGKDHVFAIRDDQLKIVALLHAAPSSEDSVEFALSVDEDKRKEGLGDKLFERGLQWCETHGVKRIYMQCLATNNAIKAMARKRDMKITTDYGESVAELAGVEDHNVLSAWLAAARSDAIGLFDLRCKFVRHQWEEYVDHIAGVLKGKTTR
jgi:GNAT superfamily N-acetyltransferase